MATPNFPNRALYHGDNLNFLRGMNSATVQLIATDPPFNKNRDFHATPNSLAAGARFEDRWRWDRDVHPDWLDRIQDDWPAVWAVVNSARASAGDDMAAFLVWLGVRLMECHRILSPDGSLYLHCDPTASHYLKALLDAIFGRHNFRNEIVWSYRTGGSSKRSFARKHDLLLFYSVGNDYTFHLQKEKSYTRSRSRKPGLVDYGAGEAEFFEDEGGVYNLVNMRDVWNIPYINSQSSERVGYPTQKPLALYERIIRAGSNEGDLVLDPFCGCATTLVAAERLGRRWAGMDIWDEAHETVIRRLQDEGLAAPDGASNGQLAFGKIHYSTTPPARNDDRAEATPPPLKRIIRIPEPPGPRLSRAAIFEILIQQNGIVCEGCDREFDDPRYLELDHKTPRSDGGVNHISNRALLCGPCNRIKSNSLTLSGLRAENRRRNRMAPPRNAGPAA